MTTEKMFPSTILLEAFCLASLLLLLLLVLHATLRRSPANSKLHPPSPPRLPIIGNIHQLGELPHRSLRRLADKHGPLMLLKLGQIPTLIVSSADAAKQVLKNHDATFCSRPPLTAWLRLSYGGLDLAFAPYDEYWKQMRKFSMVEFFGAKRVRALQGVREEEVGVLVRSVARSAARGGEVNLSEMFLCLTNNVTCREVFGKRFSEEGECERSSYHEMISESIRLMGGFCLGDFFPNLKWLNKLTGFHRRLEMNFKEMDEFLEGVINYKKSHQGCLECDDFASVLLQHEGDPTMEIPLSKGHIKAMLMVAFVAGSDTTAASLVWAMTELMRNPNALTKAQDEVRRAIAGGKGKVEESDLHHLHYLKLVIKETLRLHPPGPLILPRESIAECMVDGYVIPAKTRAYINVWAIGRDANTWEKDAEEFRPERFEGGAVDFRGQHFELLPFGSGRRICPGMAMGATMLGLALANMLYCFDWELPDGMRREDVDMSEAFGIVVNKKVPLVLKPSVVCSIKW